MNAGNVFSSSTILSGGLEAALTKYYQRCQVSLKSMAAIQGGKYGFDLQTATFYSTKSERTWSWAAEVMYRKVKRQSIDTVVGGIKEVQLDLISTLRVASCQVEKNPNQLAIWESRFPLLLQEVKEAVEGLKRLRKPYEKHSAKQEKLDKAKSAFEETVNSTLKALGEKLARLKISPPKFEGKPEKRPLNVLVPFDNCDSPQQLEFLTSFFINLEKEERYLEGKRVACKDGEYQLVKSSPDLPWSYAVTPRNNTMLHFHMSPYDAGRGRGSAFKTIKLGFFLEKKEHIVKLTTGFDFAKLSGEHRAVFEMAKKEQRFLKKMQEAPHPNVVRTHEICWRHKDGKILQIIYQSYGQQGDLFFAWDQVIHDDQKVEKILKGLISGLCHLHSLGIIVNDIKLTNIVLDKDGNPIYIDFNCSHDQGTEWAWGGTLPFTDLVVLQKQCLEKKGMKAHPSRDIWSLGLIFFLLLYKTQSMPWWPANENFASAADFEKIVQEKARLFQEPALNDIWKHACWEMLQINPLQRPTIEALRQRLQNQPLKR
ncbi:MAG: protein kinase family protein [Parachlamydia sp.]|nr:protein kinase family protein [Parachlamydia sp.]